MNKYQVNITINGEKVSKKDLTKIKIKNDLINKIINSKVGD